MQRRINQSKLLQAHFDAIAGRWDTLQAADRAEKLEKLLARFSDDLADAKQILEVGAGTGQLIPLLATIAPNSSIFAGDLAAKMLIHAQSKPEIQVQAHLIQLDAHHLPMANSQFDVVICHNAFPHFADMVAALWEIHRVLRKGGTLLILHDKSREAIHTMHKHIGEPVANDLLPDALEMQQLLTDTAYRDSMVEDTDDHYLALAYR